MASILSRPQCVNTLNPGQNGRHFADDIFKRILLNENHDILIVIPTSFVRKGPINNVSQMVQVMVSNCIEYWQSITWNNIDQVLWYHVAPLHPKSTETIRLRKNEIS